MFGLVRFCSGLWRVVGARFRVVEGSIGGRILSGGPNWAEVQCFAGDRVIGRFNFVRFRDGFGGFLRVGWIRLGGSVRGAGEAWGKVGLGHRGLASCSKSVSTTVLC